MKHTRLALCMLVLAAAAQAKTVIPLWEKGAPGFESRRDEPEQHKDWWYENIHNPSLTVFLPEAGQANESKYTLDHTAEDIRRAMRTVRARAAEWKVDPDRIGVMGWSAGGEVAAMVAYPPVPGDPKSPDPIERASARPDFQILVYPGPGGIPEKIPADVLQDRGYTRAR